MAKKTAQVVQPINHFAARVDIILLSRTETRADLARALNTTQQSLRDVLVRGTPRMDTIKKIATALGVAPQDLLKEVTEHEYAALMPRMTKG